MTSTVLTQKEMFLWTDFISLDNAQFMLYVVDKIQNGLKSVFCFSHATLIIIMMQICSLALNTYCDGILEAFVNACWVYSVESVSKKVYIYNSS